VQQCYKLFLICMEPHATCATGSNLLASAEEIMQQGSTAHCMSKEHSDLPINTTQMATALHHDVDSRSSTDSSLSGTAVIAQHDHQDRGAEVVSRHEQSGPSKRPQSLCHQFSEIPAPLQPHDDTSGLLADTIHNSQDADIQPIPKLSLPARLFDERHAQAGTSSCSKVPRIVEQHHSCRHHVLLPPSHSVHFVERPHATTMCSSDTQEMRAVAEQHNSHGSISPDVTSQAGVAVRKIQLSMTGACSPLISATVRIVRRR
jgi:hypothetical protein